jgi:hypothetical protein
MATELYPDDLIGKNQAIVDSRLKMLDCVQKMIDSATNVDKLYFTLKIFRACRLLDYNYIARTPLLSLVQYNQGEMIRGEIIELYNLSYFQGGDDMFLMPFVEE